MCRCASARRYSTCLDAKDRRDYESSSSGMFMLTTVLAASSHALLSTPWEYLASGHWTRLVQTNAAARSAQPHELVLTFFGRTAHLYFSLGVLGAVIILA